MGGGGGVRGGGSGAKGGGSRGLRWWYGWVTTVGGLGGRRGGKRVTTGGEQRAGVGDGRREGEESNDGLPTR